MIPFGKRRAGRVPLDLGVQLYWRYIAPAEFAMGTRLPPSSPHRVARRAQAKVRVEHWYDRDEQGGCVYPPPGHLQSWRRGVWA